MIGLEIVRRADAGRARAYSRRSAGEIVAEGRDQPVRISGAVY